MKNRLYLCLALMCLTNYSFALNSENSILPGSAAIEKPVSDWGGYFHFANAYCGTMVYVLSDPEAWLNSEREHDAVFFLGAAAGAGKAGETVLPPGPCLIGPGTIGGNVFNDFNNDGADAGVHEVGQKDVLVRVYGCNDVLLCETYTDADGNWFCGNAVDGETYRVEFSTPLQSYLQPGYAGVDNGTNVQVVTSPRCDVNYGVVDPADYCQENPQFSIACYVLGDPRLHTTQEAVLEASFLSGGYTPNSTFGPIGPNGSGNAQPPANESHIINAVSADVGTVRFMGYHRESNTILVASYMKRYAGFPAGPNNTALGTIYAIDRDNNPNVAVPLYVADAGVDVHDYSAPHFNAPTFGDTQARDLVGFAGWGDIEVDEENNLLYAINYHDNLIYVIPLVQSGSSITAGAVTTIAFPTAMTSLCNGDDWRPGALKIRQGYLYTAITCTALTSQNAADLHTYVVRIPTNTPAPVFEPVTDFALNYPRQPYNGLSSGWRPWLNGVETPEVMSNPSSYYPMPHVTDIEFDEGGNMVIGISDRKADYSGTFNAHPDYVPSGSRTINGGDVVRANRNNDGSYQLEDVVSGVTADTEMEFFIGDGASDLMTPGAQPSGGHIETVFGALAAQPGTHTIVAPAIYGGNLGGIRFMDAATGHYLRYLALFQTPITGVDGNGNGDFFGKAATLGDVEFLCEEIPLQIGNFVWEDKDGDGVQDACEEPGIDGVPVSLYNTSTMSFEAVTTTADGGQYYFNDVAEDTGYSLVFGYDYTSVAIDGLFDQGTGVFMVNGTAYELTTTDAVPTADGTAANDLNDSDASLQDVAALTAFPVINYTTSEATDHTLDVGLLRVIDCDLQITGIEPNCTGSDNNGSVTFTYDVTVNLSYSYPDLTTTPDGIEVTLDGITMTTGPLNTATGTTSVTFPGTSGPAYGLVVTAEFAEVPTCGDGAIIDLLACSPTCAGGGGLGGNVFNDFDNDGADAGTLEVGQANVLVEVYDCTGNLVCSTYTNADGDWSCPDLGNGAEQYRVEFSTPLQDYLQPSYAGTDNGTNVQFVNGGTCGVDYGLLTEGYCGGGTDGINTSNDLRVITTCFVAGSISSGGISDVLVAYDYDQTGAGGNQYLATKSEMGSVWALAYNKQEEVVYASSFLKRHVGMGPEGPGAVYEYDFNSNTTAPFIDLADFGIDVGTMPVTRDLGEPSEAGFDVEAFSLIGKISLGDIDISADGTSLYVMNLADKTVYEIDVASQTVAASYPTPDPGCVKGEWRPFALTVNNGKVYVGGVCDASKTGGSVGDLTATVYSLENGIFTQQLQFDLDYEKGHTNLNCPDQTGWYPWTDRYSDLTTDICLPTRFSHPQPMLSDIEFDTDGSMIIGFFDRTVHQLGQQNYLPDPAMPANAQAYSIFGGGDVLRAAYNPDGGFVLESGGNVGTLTGAANGEGPGGGEFYSGDIFVHTSMRTHAETSLGGLALIPGTNRLLLTAYDPVNGGSEQANSAGVLKLSNFNGQKFNTQGKRIFDLNTVGTFAKGGGLGDIELTCPVAPIQIGNYVWEDRDADGVQGACGEPGIDDIPVSLYNNSTMMFEAVTTTANGGQYYFNDVAEDTDYSIVFGYDYTSTATEGLFNSGTGEFMVGGTPYELTSTDAPAANDLDDSDPTLMDVATLTGYPVINYTTSDTTDHTLDAGLHRVFECDLQITSIEPNCNYLDNGGTAGFAYDVTVNLSYNYPDLATTPDRIVATLKGVSMNSGSLNTATGTTSITFPGVSGPAYGLRVTAEFFNAPSCNAFALTDLIACTPACVDGDDLGGNVFNDFDNDGAAAGAAEVGQANVLVEIYECDSDVPVATTYTNENGDWSIDDDAITYPVRVEFSTPLQDYLQPGVTGPDNGSSTQFVDMASCEVNYATVDRVAYCGEDPTMVTTCYILGPADDPGHESLGAVVTWPLSRRGTSTGSPRPAYIASIAEVGATYGLAIQNTTATAFVGAFASRNIGYGPGGNGAVYAVDLNNVADPVVIALIPNTGTTVHGTNGWYRDSDFYSRPGKESLGDVEISSDGNTLYVVNLYDKHLYSIDVTPENPTYAITDLGAIPDPGCAGGEDDWRPFALKFHKNKLYVGGVCSGETNASFAELSATVYRVELSGGSTDYSIILSRDLDGARDLVSSSLSNGRWRPWTNTFPPIPSQGFFVAYPSPLLSDIEIDEDNSLILGFRDRFPDQVSSGSLNPYDLNDNTAYGPATGGDINRACFNGASGALDAGSAVLGDWDWEGTGGCADNDPSADIEFYPDEILVNPSGVPYGHFETAQGALSQIADKEFIVTTALDPVFETGSGGVLIMNNTTGRATNNAQRGYTVFRGATAANGDGFAGKGNGLGDLEAICSPPPIQIGNYVWLDDDEDGVQDACEEPVTGLPVNLYTQDDNGDLTLVASTTTGPNGEYYFTGDGTTGETWVNGGDAMIPDTSYLIVFGDTPESDTSFVYNNMEYGLTTDSTGAGTNPGLNDSDGVFTNVNGVNLPAISYHTADTTDHSLDVGLIKLEVFDLALVKRLDLAANPGPFSPDSTVTFAIEVYNQGDIDATDVEVKDYVPAGLSLAPASAPDWTMSADTAVLTNRIFLAAGDSVTLSISFIIDSDFMGDTLTNRAEISNFDDDNDPLTDPPVDEDSTPNDNGDDDPEVNTPNEYADDGDGTPGSEDDPNDEDDYDFEGIPVLQSFDLALIKRIDTNATPGPFTYGSTVTFTIEVKNQGSLDATDVEVADYIPPGMSLVPGTTWSQDVDTARLVTPFDLAAGATEILSISFTIDLDYEGTMIDNVAEITAADNALGLPDEDSTPGNNGNDDPEVDTDDEADDDGPHGNGMADNPADSDDFDWARLMIETVSLGSTVFLDNNNDGFQNGADTGIANVEVQIFDASTGMQVLTDANGARVIDPAAAATVTTDVDGNYHFTNLLPGDYYVVIPTSPTAAPVSSNNTGIAFTETDPDDNLDNDDEGVQPGGAGTGVSSGTVTLTLGGEPENGAAAGTETGQGNMLDNAFDSNGNMTLDFGFFAPVSVGDTAFVDLDGNGLQDIGEPGIGGVTIVLFDSSGDTVMIDAEGNAITGVTMTAADGSYTFGNLPPGSYSVGFDISTSDNAEFYDFTTADAGGDDANDSDNSIALTDSTAQSAPTDFLNSGETDLTLDIGVVCAIQVIVAEPFTICATQPIILNDDASIAPASLGGSWSTPDGTGVFTTGVDFSTATTYIPSKGDALRGAVTLILTTNEPDGPCEPVRAQIIVEILKVDCGAFFWNGQ